MNNFKDFVNELDKIHRATKQKYDNAVNAWKIAQREYDATNADPNANEIAKAIAKGDYLKAKETYDRALSELQEAHNSQIQQLRSDASAFAESVYRVTPDKLDDKAMQLLNTGIMKVSDLEYMATQYRHNPVMLQIIAQHAQNVADQHNRTSGDVETRQKASALAYKLKAAKDHNKALEAFNSLADASASAFGKDTVWAKVNDAHWERFHADACAAYDNFLVQPGGSEE